MRNDRVINKRLDEAKVKMSNDKQHTYIHICIHTYMQTVKVINKQLEEAKVKMSKEKHKEFVRELTHKITKTDIFKGNFQVCVSICIHT
jgi:hypothetical protein